MQKIFMLLVALTFLSIGMVEADLSKQSPKKIDLNELQAKYVKKLYVEPRLSNLQV
jgi:hypothetical protein